MTYGHRIAVFIYSCPSSSAIKYRMIYSSSASSVHQTAKSLLSSRSTPLANRKIETSDPKEVDEAFLRSELGLVDDSGFGNTIKKDEEKRPFARPRGPGRKR